MYDHNHEINFDIQNPEHRQVLLTKLNLLLKTNIRKVFFERASELCDYLHQTKEIAFLQYISKYISGNFTFIYLKLVSYFRSFTILVLLYKSSVSYKRTIVIFQKCLKFDF